MQNKTIMQYETFKSIFNDTIFEKSKSDLITKVANLHKSTENYLTMNIFIMKSF